MKAIIQSYNRDTGKAILQTCISFKDLKSIARFTARRKPDWDPYSTKTESNSDYQRMLNEQHVKDIVEYIESSIKRVNSAQELGIFPTSMLIAFSSELEQNTDNIVEIDLPDPNKDEYCYVVDGQHRLMGMIKFYEKTASQKEKNIIENYIFNCTILLNYDLWEQARVFADVNFKQKKVNKSLYYDIYGSLPPETSSDYWQNAIFIAHSLVECLYRDKESPLHDNIKMLGTGKGVISQAFIVEALLRHIQSPKGIWYIDSSITVSDSKLECMKLEIFEFLKIVKSHFSDIWENENYIIRKTTGMGALLRLMGKLHDEIKFQNNVFDEKFFKNEYKKLIDVYISNLTTHTEKLFKKGGTYGKTGGKGNELGLYREMLNILGLENS